MGKVLTRGGSSSKAAVEAHQKVNQTRRINDTCIQLRYLMRRRTIPRAGKREPHTYYDWGQRPYVPHLLCPSVAAFTGGDTSNGI